MVNPHLKLIIHPECDWDETGRNRLEKDLQNYEHLITQLGEARGWGGNPRYDLILDEGIRAYLSGTVDKREK
jgi:hypothetical protein